MLITMAHEVGMGRRREGDMVGEEEGRGGGGKITWLRRRREGDMLGGMGGRGEGRDD